MAEQEHEGPPERVGTPPPPTVEELQSLRGILAYKKQQLVDMGIQMAMMKESLDELRAERASTRRERPEGGVGGATGGPTQGILIWRPAPYAPKLMMPTLSLLTYDGVGAVQKFLDRYHCYANAQGLPETNDRSAVRPPDWWCSRVVCDRGGGGHPTSLLGRGNSPVLCPIWERLPSH